MTAINLLNSFSPIVNLAMSEGGSQPTSEKLKRALIPVWPPSIEDNFAGNFKEDASIVADNPQLWLLSSGSALGALGLGMHDFANAMGTTVGALVLTFNQARIIGAGAMFYGAAFGSKKTAETVKSGVVDFKQTSLGARDTQNLMSAALYGSGLWIILTNMKGIPMSTTQATVGGIWGAASVAEAIKTNDYSDIGKGINWTNAGKFAKSWLASIGGGIIGGAAVYGLGLRWLYHFTEFNPWIAPVWRFAPIVTGTLVAYGIGCNDTGHAIGPLAGGIDAGKHNSAVGGASNVNQWLNIFGAWFVAAGLWNWGHHLTDTLGSRLGGMNPAKAIAAEFTTFGILNYFKSMGIPVSSSETIASAILGVTLGSGKTPPPFFFGRMVTVWIVSIPLSAITAGLAYTVVSSYESIDRDAPAVNSHGSAVYENLAIPMLRMERPMAQLAVASLRGGRTASTLGSRLLRKTPFGVIGAVLLYPALSKMGEEGPVYAGAELLKVLVELLPFVGGGIQFADGAYEFRNEKTFITNAEASKTDALMDMIVGGVSVLLSSLIFMRRLPAFDKAAEQPAPVKTGGRPAWATAIRYTLGSGVAKWVERMVKDEHNKESSRKERAAFRNDTNKEAIGEIVKEAGFGGLRRFLLEDSMNSAMLSEGRKVLGHLAVRDYANRLAREIVAATYKGSIPTALAIKLLDTIEAVRDRALEKSNPTIIGEAVQKAVLANGNGRGTEISAEVKRMLRFVRKQVPEGFALLDRSSDIRSTFEQMSEKIASGDPELYQHFRRSIRLESYREFYRNRILRAATELGQKWKALPTRLNLRTAVSSFVGTITWGYFINLIKIGYEKFPTVKTATGAVGRYLVDWGQTVLPYKSPGRMFAAATPAANAVLPTTESVADVFRSAGNTAAELGRSGAEVIAARMGANQHGSISDGSRDTQHFSERPDGVEARWQIKSDGTVEKLDRTEPNRPTIERPPTTLGRK